MKKKILFIEESLDIGGAEKSLITILSMFNYQKYEVDLFLFRHTGTFMDKIPNEVNLLSIDEGFKEYSEKRRKSPLIYLKRFQFKKMYHSLMYLLNATISNLVLKKTYNGWEHIKYMFKPLEKEYDVAISFLEGKTNYYNIDKVRAKKRVGFVHSDYSKYPFDYKLDKKYFKHFDYIATVSENCKKVLIDIFPEYKDKFIVIKNMINVDEIREMANEEIELIKEEDETTIVTVGRLTYPKGIDNAILVCKALVDDGYKIKWYIVGKGEDKEKLEELIKANKLENNFILLGAKTNPYKYMKFADIYVQPSRFEGYGITVAEAKALNKVIITTDIPEFREQIEENVTGLLCNKSDELINSIKLIIDEPQLANKFIENLKMHLKENLNELSKFYKIIEGEGITHNEQKKY